MLLPMRPALAAVLALVSTAAATLLVQDGKLSVVDSVSASLVASTAFTSDYKYQMTDTDSLKVQFTVTRDGKPFQPQQAAILVSPTTTTSTTGARTIQVPVKVRANSGKAKVDLDSAKLTQGSARRGAVDLTLLVGHPNQPSLSIPLGTITLPESLASTLSDDEIRERLPKHWEAEKYAPQPEIRWTFRGGEKQINPLVALVGLGVVLAPWTILLATIPRLLPQGRLPSPSLSQTLFLLSLVALEGLSVLSWVYFLPVLTTLPFFGAIGIVAVGTGRQALGEMARRRKADAVGGAEKKRL